MLPEIGHFCLIAAWVIALVQSVVPLWGAWKQAPAWVSLARPLAYWQCGLLAISFGFLVYAFVNNDFTVKYVAEHSNSYLPVGFKVAAVWGGHEGSLLLWGLILAGWGAAVAAFSRSMPADVVARVVGVMGLISTGFLSFMIFTSNPFDRYLPDFPVDGSDLNPLLQDFGLIVHPPMLYMGYVGFSVAFAFAIEGLLSGRLDSAWARWSRPWTTVAWCFLTLGIALGSWWAYYELGWGGWWFWDPVENASFMPWLVGTALMHSLAVTEKRGVFKAWTVLLAILAFSLSLLGTFLVRSGVLTSVHAFATDPTRGAFILGFLLVVIGGSLSLFAFRAHRLNSESQYQLFSREVFLMLNNLILVVATVVVLLGTLFPLIAEVLGLGKLSVGPPYFNFLFVPLTLILMFTLGVGVLVNWKRHRWAVLLKPLLSLAVVALVCGAFIPTMVGDEYQVRTALAMGLVAWVFAANAWDVYRKVSVAKQGWVAGFNRLSRSYKGMLLAHIGLGISVIGVTMTSLYSVEKRLVFTVGETVQINEYEFVFQGVSRVRGQNYDADRGEVLVRSHGEIVAMLYPEQRDYWSSQNAMTEAAIDPGFTRDLYVSLHEPLDESREQWEFLLYVRPFVRWIWAGSIFMALGGVLAISDRRYRLGVKNRMAGTHAPAKETATSA